MGKNNEHRAFLVTEVKKTIKHIVPSIDMDREKLVKTQHILEANRVSFIANHPNEFPPDPEENEITVKDDQFWIYSKRDSILDWHSLGGSGEGGNYEGDILAKNVIQDQDHRFLNDAQVIALNNLMDGIIIDGGDLPAI